MPIDRLNSLHIRGRICKYRIDDVTGKWWPVIGLDSESLCHVIKVVVSIDSYLSCHRIYHVTGTYIHTLRT